ncbi:MAG: pirin family protein [Kineosporiaceae bacterium]|jgi:quercetin 2,3-dioxygenase
MPAVTVDDPRLLPRIPEPVPGSGSERSVRSISTAPAGYEGDGFPVRRGFAGVATAWLDPFLHLDQIGEIDYAPGEPRGTPWHPHRGFETVTYVMDGAFEHQDSHGGGGLIRDGDTQWMTAGSGLLHIERPPEPLIASGGPFHAIQLWVNLPRARKWSPPRYQSIPADRVLLLASPDAGALVRVIAGELAGHRGPGVTHTAITLVHASLAPGARLRLPWPNRQNALVYQLAGQCRVGPARHPLTRGQLAVLGDGDTLTIDAPGGRPGDPDTGELLILGGVPIREPVVAYGPFVMSTREEIRHALEDYQAGRMGSIPVARD